VRILLDENLDWRLERFLPGHEVKSVTRLGWAGLKNGALLARAQKHFDLLITMDNPMVSQQNLSKLQIALIVLRAPSNRLADTGPLMPKVLSRLTKLKPGKVVRISG
jgi:predicted nuclease of predicted toxin-antitoxin system